MKGIFIYLKYLKNICKFIAIISLLPQLINGGQDYKLIKNAKIYTMGRIGILEKGDILIKGKKIENIGENISVLSPTQILDLAGKCVIPGMICASSYIYLYKKEMYFKGDGSPDTDILEAMDYYDQDISEILSHGITSAYISPFSTKMTKGLGAVVKLNYVGEPPEILKPKAGLNFILERMQDKKTSNILRLKQYYEVRELFNTAKYYKKEWEDYNRQIKDYEEFQQKELVKDKLKRPKKPIKNESNEILIEALDQKIPVRLLAHRADSILNALRLKDEFGLNIVIEGAGDWPEVLGDLKESSVPVLSNPLINYKKSMIPGGPKGYAASLLKIPEEYFFYSEMEMKGQIKQNNWAALINSGIPFIIVPPDDFVLSAKNLRIYASWIVSYGVPMIEALKMITIKPAEILGVADRIGSLEAGKDADIVVLNGEPLNSLAEVEMVFINGNCIWQRNKQF